MPLLIVQHVLHLQAWVECTFVHLARSPAALSRFPSSIGSMAAPPEPSAAHGCTPDPSTYHLQLPLFYLPTRMRESQFIVDCAKASEREKERKNDCVCMQVSEGRGEWKAEAKEISSQPSARRRRSHGGREPQKMQCNVNQINRKRRPPC